jgi:hypothetical protein
MNQYGRKMALTYDRQLRGHPRQSSASSIAYRQLTISGQ